MTVFLVDGFPLIREALANLLRRHLPGLKVVQLDRFASLTSAFEEHGHPSLICLELVLSDTIGVAGLFSLKSNYPTVPVVVFSGLDADIMEQASLDMGAIRYIEKSTPTAEIAAIFDQLLHGKDVLDMPSIYHPTKKQLEVLRLVDKGFQNQAIANTMGITLFTVNVHLHRLFGHIKVKNRIQAVLYARKHHFLP